MSADGHTVFKKQGPRQITAVSLNVWGIKYISKHTNDRIKEVAHRLAQYDPLPNIVALQECFCQAEFDTIREKTRSFLPYAKYFYSGIFGGGLAILSKWPIEESSMTGYTVNGLPWAFWRGDWYVGKGFAQARIRIPADGDLPEEVVDVYNTHLHAPYHPADRDFYLAHRLTQAWQIAKAIRDSVHSRQVSLVLALGDFNTQPKSIPYQIITKHGYIRDSWLEANLPTSDADVNPCNYTTASAVNQFGTTCDSQLNTWRWSEALRKEAFRGHPAHIPDDTPNPFAKRLDYVFFANGGRDRVAQRPGTHGGSDPDEGLASRWVPETSRVGLTELHPTLHCSLSDHFSVETTFTRLSREDSSTGSDIEKTQPAPSATYPSSSDQHRLSQDDYRAILSHITTFALRERKVRRLRLAHFGIQTAIAIGCMIAIWFIPFNFVGFILLFIAVIGFGFGLLDGLMGGFFVSAELSGLAEFAWDVEAKIEGRSESSYAGRTHTWLNQHPETARIVA